MQEKGQFTVCLVRYKRGAFAPFQYVYILVELLLLETYIYAMQRSAGEESDF
jgi:hypothetical protein